MLGYATKISELATDETPDFLLTGDIACKTEQNLFYIVDPSSRFVKPFGILVSLDEIQSYVKETLPHSVVTGDDKQIVIAIKKEEGSDYTNCHLGLLNVIPYLVEFLL